MSESDSFTGMDKRIIMLAVLFFVAGCAFSRFVSPPCAADHALPTLYLHAPPALLPNVPTREA